MITNDRAVQIEVSGLCQQGVMNRSTYTVKVPYSSLSKTMQSISRMGGKIVGVVTTPGPIGPSTASLKATPVAAPEAKPAPKKGKKK